MTLEVTFHPYDDELDDVAVDFHFGEVSEPEEMTDDDSDFSRSELKIEFTPRKFIQFTLIKLLLSFIFLDLGSVYMTNIP